MSGKTVWPADLASGKIRAVPSYHFWPEFAQLVRQQIADYQPDLVAVELPDNLQTLVLRAVSFLPALSAVLTPADEFFPVTPEDSIIEAIRSAVEKGIEVAFVDLDIAEELPLIGEGRDFFADSAMLEGMNLSEFMELSSTKLPEKTQNKAFLAREEHMSARLIELSEKHERILFVCGMVHWRRIKKRLSQKNQLFSHRLPPGGALASITPKAVAGISGMIPFRAACYEKARASVNFNLKTWLSSLFTEAGKSIDHEISGTELTDLLRFGRNQAIIAGKLAPDLGCLDNIGQAIIDQYYSASVRKKCREYEFGQAPLPLSIDYEEGFFLRSGQKKYPLQPYQGWGLEKSGDENESPDLVDERVDGRNHPEREEILRHPYRPLSDYWGRYGDEMDEEERFVSTLERWACQKGSGDEFETAEFADGLLDGIDVGATIRDLVSGRLFIKEFSGEEPRFSAVMVEFNHDFRGFADPIYTYGRHKALAFTSPDRPNREKPGTASREFSLLLSFKRLIDNEKLWAMYDQMLKLQAKGRLNPREILMKMAMQYCPAEELLIVASQLSLAIYRDLAARSGVKGGNSFTALAREDIWGPACDRLKVFNVYYYL
ncbi:MAG: hypothetical protein AB1403_10790 [Candidatus Riflebacteria bacterium]